MIASRKGYLSEQEARLLFDAATKADGCVVEIGAYCGRSTTALAETGKQVITIDPLQVGYGDGNNMQVSADDVRALDAVVGQYPNVTWIRDDVANVTPPANIGLLWIDGNHLPPHPLDNFRHFQAVLRPGALVAFHDFEQFDGVTAAVRTLESEARIRCVAQAGSLYVGRVMSRVLIAQPGYGTFETESYYAGQKALINTDTYSASVVRTKSSLLAHNFNDCLVKALNEGYEYFAMLHTDIAVDAGWLNVMLDEMASLNVEVMHAPAAIKDIRGLTSTAVAMAPDDWALPRRLTVKELKRLPETFTVADVRKEIEPDALWLLPNTGCLVFRADTWARDFPGFNIKDRVFRHSSGQWCSDVLPEDWNFGLWCGRHGIEVAGTTKVVTKHYGRVHFQSNAEWGEERDEFYYQIKSEFERAET